MSAARLYAIELDGALVTVRASVWIPNLSEQYDGEVPYVDVVAVNGIPVQRLVNVSDEEWMALDRAVLAAERERRLFSHDELA